MLGKMTLTENRPSGAEIFVNRNVVSSLLGPPNIATLANKFVTGSPVSKFWTVNLSTHGVPLVGGTGVVVNRIFILFSLFIRYYLCHFDHRQYAEKREPILSKAM